VEKNSVLTIFVYDKITKGRSSLQTRLSKFTAKTFYLISSSLTDFQTAEAKNSQVLEIKKALKIHFIN